MSLYARQSAWLSAALERPKGDKSEAPMLSRIERERKNREDEHYQPDMPPLDGGGRYLLDYLFEIGPVMPSAAGPVAITNGELRAWQDNVGLRMEPWEARVIRNLSREYVAELHRAEKPDAKAPWQPVDYVPDYAGTAKSMRKAIADLAKT